MYHVSFQGADICKYLNHTNEGKGQRRHVLITHKDKEDMFLSHTQSYAITSQTLLDFKLSKYVQ